MKTIFKSSIPVVDQTIEVEMPVGSQIVNVDSQFPETNAAPTVEAWYLCDDGEPLVKRYFRVIGTGHQAPAGTYLGTAITRGGRLVWHLFEVRP